MTTERLQILVDHCKAQGFPVYNEPNLVNILYLEGADEDGTPNRDEFNRWNDRRILYDLGPDGKPRLLYNAVATTEPGKEATMSPAAKAVGGVARIMFGFHSEAWEMGFHKNAWHPALVQRGTVWVHRDLNQDGFRTNDKISKAQGLNQHSTSPTADPDSVGLYSAGCLVGRNWIPHTLFIAILKADARYRKNPKFRFSTTVLDTTKINWNATGLNATGWSAKEMRKPMLDATKTN